MKKTEMRLFYVGQFKKKNKNAKSITKHYLHRTCGTFRNK